MVIFFVNIIIYCIVEIGQWRNIAYCLSLLNYNDKSIRKLNELSKFYQDKLNDEEIKLSFNSILTKVFK